MDNNIPASGCHSQIAHRLTINDGSWSQSIIEDGDFPVSLHHNLPQTRSSHADQHTAMSAGRSLLPDFEEDLGSHDSFLEYIDSMLMDETFEDSSWQQLLANSGTLTDRFNGFNSHSSENLSSSLSLTDRYRHILRGFHEILDENSTGFDDSSFPSNGKPSNGNGHKASYGLIASEGLWSRAEVDDKEAIPGGCHEQQPEDDRHMGIFLYNSASGMYTSEIGQATSVSSNVAQDQAGVFEPIIRLDQHNARGQHNDQLAIITGILPNQCNADVGADMLFYDAAGGIAQQMHTHVNPGGSSLPRHPLKVAEEDVSLVRNTDLPAELYAQLFDEWPQRRSKAAAGGAARALPKGERREDAALSNPIDLKALLLSSAKAAGEGNVKRAMEFLQQIQQQGGACPHGSGLQRVVHYFSEALKARLSGMGSVLYKAMASTAQLPSPLLMVKAYKMVFEVCPFVKIAYHFANQYILKAVSGASRLHIVDYGILYGFQWPCLMYALAHRCGGPPFVRITGIEFPANPTDINPAATTEGTSHRLTEYAKSYNVPFEYHAMSASKWEEIEPSSLHISQDEVLVLNSFNRLSHLLDDSVMHPSPRDKLLKRMRGLNPQLLVVGSVNAAHNSPFFAPRFREAFHYYSNTFDVLHTTLLSDSPEREMFERELMGRAILNVVACEGMERVEIPETYKPWEARIKRAGFRQLPIIPSVMSTARTVMKSYHKDFSLFHDSNMWMLLGWRGRSMQALSAWEPI